MCSGMSLNVCVRLAYTLSTGLPCQKRNYTLQKTLETNFMLCWMGTVTVTFQVLSPTPKNSRKCSLNPHSSWQESSMHILPFVFRATFSLASDEWESQGLEKHAERYDKRSAGEGDRLGSALGYSPSARAMWKVNTSMEPIKGLKKLGKRARESLQCIAPSVKPADLLSRAACFCSGFTVCFWKPTDFTN